MKLGLRLILSAVLAAAVLGVSTNSASAGAEHAGPGYWMLAADGTVYGFGDAKHAGNAPAGVVDLEPSPSGHGYLVADERGRVFAYGDGVACGDGVGRLSRGERVVSMSVMGTTPCRGPNGGYWLFTDQGRVLAFGTAARHHGDMAGTKLNGPVLDSVATPSGQGYWMVASDGGIFTFGDAKFYGSMGGKPLNQPVMSMAADPDGVGYWLVASDGGIFAFEAEFRGSMGATRLNKPISGMVGGPGGYLMVAEDGGIFAFGDNEFHGSLGANPPPFPVVAVAVISDPSSTPSPGSSTTVDPSPVTTTTTTTAVPPTTTTTEPTSSGPYYDNCSEARAAGAAPIYRGQPGYRPALDRDSDGIACE